MRGRYVGESDPGHCISGRDYEIIGFNEDFDCYGVIDEVGMCAGVAYLYDKDDFEIIEDTPFRDSLNDSIAKMQEEAESSGYYAARYLRNWQERDIYELLSREQCLDSCHTRILPVLVSYDGKRAARLTDEKYKGFLK